MDNETITIKNYTLHDYRAASRRPTTESLPDSLAGSLEPSHSTLSAQSDESPPSQSSPFLRGGSARGSFLGGTVQSSASLRAAELFDTELRSPSACSFSSFAEPEVYDPFPGTCVPERWPAHLRLCCYYCSLQITGRPWPICTGTDSHYRPGGSPPHASATPQAFRVETLYCSPCHIKREFLQRPRSRETEEAWQATLTAVGLLVHRNLPDLPVGLPKDRLAKFCGVGGMRDADYFLQNQQHWDDFLSNL